MDLDIATLGTILGIWAHPDDEAYLMGGLMAMATLAGQHVACVTATLGDAGETADPQRWPAEQLSRIRREELHSCLELLGVTDHRSLDLPDGRLPDVDPTRPIAQLGDAIRRVQPDTVITFGPDGMTGHPDHQVISAWTGHALARATGEARLLWATKTSAWADGFAAINKEVFPPGLPPVAPADAAWHLALDDDILERKVRALEAHASQTASLIAFMGRERYADWARDEIFQHGVPAREFE